MKIERIHAITKQEYIEEYIMSNKPVIVTDGMKDWDLSKFTPDYFKKEFGEEQVQVYDELFDLQGVVPFREYIDKNFGRTEEEGLTKEYMRWYTKLKEVDFYWSDKVFKSLEGFWSHPYFLPNESLVVPYSKSGQQRDITKYRYPYKGLFVSGKGSRTRLHKDPFNSNAILCQFYGEKKIFLYNPEKESQVMNGKEFVDIQQPDHQKFPDFSKITYDYEDVLKPGEIVLFPSGWFHDVTSQSDSISITWNFLYDQEYIGLCNHIEKNPEDDQLEILRFFLKDEIRPDASNEDIVAFFKNKFEEIISF
ncbi:cupin-like domain-containing protein [Aquimarina hainanensis]|uniref:Cupin-like domain-containing protein n=1 Tax=Aquimarina hainanensis TaxID=1578017 RepID=A0ABW5NB04_9FLAO